MNDTKQYTSERSPDYLAATLREVAETLTDVGKTIDARLGAWEETAEPEPKPPSVEVMSAATGALRRYRSITAFERMGTMWWVCGETVGGGNVHTMTTPFAIWQSALAAGVPCCDPPYADLTLNIGDRWRVFSIMELRVSPHTGNSFIRCIGNRPDYGARYAVENTYYVTESPDAIRALCDAAGVPCPEEEKPETVQCSGWTWTHIRRVTVRARSNSTLDTTITGVSNSGSGKEFDLHSARTTPAQVVALCKLAGWPKPEVHMVCTFCDGTPCEIDPASVCSVDTIRLPGERSTLVTCEDGSTSCFVREPVAVVEAMRDACKEGE